MSRLEKILISTTLALMLLFASLVLYAGIGRGIHLPTSHKHLAPFSEGKVITKENNQFEIYYVAKMWAFDPLEVILPEKADVDVYLSAADVMHGFEVVGTNLNLMAIPGTVNVAHQRFDKKGEYLVVCHEYCGLNHQNMFSKIRVVDPAEYTRLAEEMARRITSVGEQLSVKHDCASCHTTDGTESLGPTFKGLFGKRQKLTDGSEVVVNEAYLIDSIRHPDKQIPINYEPGSMPETTLTEEELRQLVAYIKALE
ncbi:MAG TPA: c-type cytochrome [Acidobacteriota bacterium]|nr:c-type cytochrome [Acidobacteriota bacterium]